MLERRSQWLQRLSLRAITMSKFEFHFFSFFFFLLSFFTNSMKKLQNQADIFSFAIIMWEVFFEDKPYKDQQALNVIHFKVSQDPNCRPIINYPNPSANEEQLFKAMRQSWNHDPAARPNSAQLLEFFTRMLSNITSHWKTPLGRKMEVVWHKKKKKKLSEKSKKKKKKCRRIFKQRKDFSPKKLEFEIQIIPLSRFLFLFSLKFLIICFSLWTNSLFPSFFGFFPPNNSILFTSKNPSSSFPIDFFLPRSNPNP